MSACTTHHHACGCREALFRRMAHALDVLYEEYEGRASLFGSEYLWQKHENLEAVRTARAVLGKWKSTNPTT